MCMFPACCFRQRTYMAQGLGNRVLNETWTHFFSLMSFKFNSTLFISSCVKIDVVILDSIMFWVSLLFRSLFTNVFFTMYQFTYFWYLEVRSTVFLEIHPRFVGKSSSCIKLSKFFPNFNHSITPVTFCWVVFKISADCICLLLIIFLASLRWIVALNIVYLKWEQPTFTDDYWVFHSGHC